MKLNENEKDFIHPDPELAKRTNFDEMKIKKRMLSKGQHKNAKDYCFELRLLIDIIEDIDIVDTKKYLINLEKRMRNELQNS